MSSPVNVSTKNVVVKLQFYLFVVITSKGFSSDCGCVVTLSSSQALILMKNLHQQLPEINNGSLK